MILSFPEKLPEANGKTEIYIATRYTETPGRKFSSFTCFISSFGLAPGIPPTAVGGWLRSSLQAAATLFNPPNGSWGMVKIRPPRLSEQVQFAARRLDFNHPPTAVYRPGTWVTDVRGH